MKINEELIRNNKNSVDLIGSVFTYEEKLLRGINIEFIEQTKNLLSSGLIDELVENNLFPKTRITDYSSSIFELIIQHEKIDFISYCFEWSFHMMVDAALAVLEVEDIANKYGYQLKDPHAYNIVFNKNKPIYIDFGSFVKKTNDTAWIGIKDFLYGLYIPLYLFSENYENLGRTLMYQYNHLSEDEYLRLCYPMMRMLPVAIRNIILNLNVLKEKSDENIDSRFSSKIVNVALKSVRDFLNNNRGKEYYRKRINKFTRTEGKSTVWESYHTGISSETDPRMVYIGNTIKKLSGIDTYLELGANQGAFTRYISEITEIPNILAVDYDEGAVDRMYLNNKDNSKLNIALANPFVPDISTFYGVFIERFKSDIVVCMALTHHLILTQNLSINFILDTIFILTKKYLIIEFMPLGLYDGTENSIKELPSLYTEEWFAYHLSKRSTIIEKKILEKNRIAFFCNKDNI